MGFRGILEFNSIDPGGGSGKRLASLMAPRTEPQPALGHAIKLRREELGLSQEELGLKAEIHPTWISHIESGRNNPAWGSIRRIAAALNLKVSELAARAEALDS